MSSPFEQFTLTPCHPLRLAASSNLFSLLGLLQPTDAPSFACSESSGIKLVDQQVATLRSSKTLDDLREHLAGQNEWSLSTWITASLPPNDELELPMLQPILAFGSGTVSRQVQTDAGCGGYYMMIAQFDGHLVFGFEDSAQACRMVRMSMFELQQDVPVSLTVTTSGSTTNAYIQGQLVVENINFAADLTRLPANQTMQLFPQVVGAADSTTSPFRGSILQVSFFDETLTSTEVQGLFEEGIGEAAVVPLYLEARASDAVVIEQDVPVSEPALIWIGGTNTSTATLPLLVDMQNLPTKGELFTAEGKVGVSRIPIPVNSTGLWIEYRRPSGDYFTVPTMNAYGETLELSDESFRYRVVAQYEQRLLAASQRVTQTIQIQNVNHAPTWITTNEALASVANDIPIYNFSFPTLIDEADLNLNRVRVDLAVLHGRISLRSESSSLADFDFCNRRSYSAWQCTSDGLNKKRISFVAIPGDVAEILAGLSYQGFVPGNEDALVMDVYDGVGGQCLDEREHQAWKSSWSTESSSQFSSLSRGCYHVQSQITIPSISISGGTKSGGSSLLSYMNLDFQNFGSADIVFWVVFVAMCYCLFHCFRRCFPNCLARGPRVNADRNVSQDQSKVAEETIQAEIKVEEAAQQPVADDLV